jgi:hypothetical protein
MTGVEAMAGQQQPIDPTRVDLANEAEIAYWTEHFGVSREVLQSAIDVMGPLVKDIGAHLEKRACPR